MQKIILYTIVIVFSLVTKAVAQEGKFESKKNNNKEKSFEKQVEQISTSMEFLIAREKNELKVKIDSLGTIFQQKKISAEEFQDLKLKEAEKSANRIEFGMERFNSKLDSLIQNKVEKGSKEVTFKIDTIKGKKVYTYSKVTDGRHYDIPALKIYMSDEEKTVRKSKRTTSQFVFAFGLNNVITDGENLEDSDYRVWGSHFYEWGVTYNSRIFKNNNLLHAKYGLSLMYNNLRPTDNRYFVKNGDQTDLVTSTVKLDDSRFRNVYLTAPLHLEFDFTPKKLSKDGTKTYFRTHESVRLGIGGYGGVRIKSKQILKYEADDIKVKEKQKGDFNVSDFTYGLSAYVGYGQTSLYVKYDLNPMFKNNNIDQNNVSLGLRFDFN
jgi:hypothetical protein